MAVLAKSLSRNALLEAFMERRFYSTLDNNLEMSFTINDQEMGAVLFPGLYNGEIRLHDAEEEVFTKVELISNGLIIRTYSLYETAPVVVFDVEACQLDYYYIIATQEDGDQAISSPIFIDNEQIITVIDETLNDTGSIVVQYSPERKIFVRLPANSKSSSIIISDLSGRLVADQQVFLNELTEISLNNIKPGIYLVFVPEYPELGSRKIVVW